MGSEPDPVEQARNTTPEFSMGYAVETAVELKKFD
jgi:hypothetical protein